MEIKILIGMNCTGRGATSTISPVGRSVSNAMHPEIPAADPHILPSHHLLHLVKVLPLFKVCPRTHLLLLSYGLHGSLQPISS